MKSRRLSPGDLRWSGVPGAVGAGGPAGPGALSARGAKGLPVQRRLGPSGDHLGRWDEMTGATDLRNSKESSISSSTRDGYIMLYAKNGYVLYIYIYVSI